MATGRSLYSEERECWICHRPQVHRHHIYGGNGRRQISDREGCWLYLCPNHHNMSRFGIHFDKELDKAFKEDCQRRWMRQNNKTTQDFIDTFGRSYL